MPCWRETMERPWNIVGMEADDYHVFRTSSGSAWRHALPERVDNLTKRCRGAVPRRTVALTPGMVSGTWSPSSTLSQLFRPIARIASPDWKKMYGGRCMRHQSPFC